MQSNLEIKKPKREKKPGLEIPANIALEQDSSTVPHIPTETVIAPKKRKVKTLEEKIADKIARQNKITDELVTLSSGITRKRREGKTVRPVREKVNRAMLNDYELAKIPNNQNTENTSFHNVVMGGPHERLVYSDNNAVFVEQGLDPSNYKKLTDAVEGRVANQELSFVSGENTEDETSYIPIASFTSREKKEPLERNVTPQTMKFHKEQSTSDFERMQRNLKNYSDSKIERNNRGFLSKLKDSILDYFAKDEDFEDDE